VAQPQDLPYQPQGEAKVASRGHRKDALWPYYTGTLAYLVFGGIVAFDRWGEIGSLFESANGAGGAAPVHLPLNSLGDVLAGFFAPLAFLWLFAATQLQRTELKLQREELADTRSVLDDQRKELERAARESNEQTRIMQMTLESARAKEVFEEHNLRLYYLARELLRAKGLPIAAIEPGRPYGYQYAFVQNKKNNLSQNEPASIDEFYEDFGENIKALAGYAKSGVYLYLEEEYRDKILDAFAVAVPALIRLSDYIEINTTELVRARIRGMHLDELSYDLNYLNDWVKIAPPSQPPQAD
jgi:hypothetical protein